MLGKKYIGDVDGQGEVTDGKGELRRIVQVIVHPEFNMEHPMKKHDIAVAQFITDVEFSGSPLLYLNFF